VSIHSVDQKDLDRLRAEVVELVQSALPLTEVAGEWRKEHQALLGDGGWHSVDVGQAVRYHQQGYRIRERRVTNYVEVER
jgi:hypothetical protein